MTMFKSLLLLCILSSTFGLSGCNTMSGAGQDIEAAGEAIEDAAEGAR